jgi:hypothetical protein
MSTVTFTTSSASGGSTQLTIVPGSLQLNAQHDDRGGSNVPRARAGIARNGQCQVVVTDDNLASIVALRSGAGVGAVDVTGSDIPAAQQAYDALVDLELGGDSVQVATITWKGTTAAA